MAGFGGLHLGGSVQEIAQVGDLVAVSDPLLAALGESCVGGDDERLSLDASDALDADLRGRLDDIR